MLRLYDPQTALQTILKRTPPDDMPVSEKLRQGIAALFGESLTPEEAVTRILADVRAQGDAALQRWTRTLDGLALETFRIPPETARATLESLPAPERAALERAAARIEDFHRRQPLTSWMTHDMGGALGQLIRPIRRVGLYVPGGSAPLPSSVLMSAIPARVAGVEQIVVVTPPNRAFP
ncbi:MAG: histidinol dehydrogenase, partial [Anaerolineae bacterium]